MVDDQLRRTRHRRRKGAGGHGARAARALRPRASATEGICRRRIADRARTDDLAAIHGRPNLRDPRADRPRARPRRRHRLRVPGRCAGRARRGRAHDRADPGARGAGEREPRGRRVRASPRPRRGRVGRTAGARAVRRDCGRGRRAGPAAGALRPARDLVAASPSRSVVAGDSAWSSSSRAPRARRSSARSRAASCRSWGRRALRSEASSCRRPRRWSRACSFVSKRVIERARWAWQAGFATLATEPSRRRSRETTSGWSRWSTGAGAVRRRPGRRCRGGVARARGRRRLLDRLRSTASPLVRSRVVGDEASTMGAREIARRAHCAGLTTGSSWRSSAPSAQSGTPSTSPSTRRWSEPACTTTSRRPVPSSSP